MSAIPEMYINQAIKARGNTVNERLNYLLNWYVTTGTKVAKDATWDYQIEFNNLMAEFGNTLRPILMRDTDDETRNAIVNFLPVVDHMRVSPRTAAGLSMFTYLSIELRKIINV